MIDDAHWGDNAEAIAEQVLSVADTALRGIELLGDVSDLPDDVKRSLLTAKDHLEYVAERCDIDVRQANG